MKIDSLLIIQALSDYKSKDRAELLGNAEFSSGEYHLGTQNLTKERTKVDFRRGFYTTKDRLQTEKWAKNKFGSNGAVTEFRLPQSELQALNSLDVGAATRFSLFRVFRHNRLGGRLHTFDTVSGPMLENSGSFLKGKPRKTIGQKTSWHSEQAVKVLWKGLVQ
jgi:hypothetical protein